MVRWIRIIITRFPNLDRIICNDVFFYSLLFQAIFDLNGREMLEYINVRGYICFMVI